MHDPTTREVLRYKVRGEPYYVYYSPGLGVRAHDHNYILRLVSDSIAALRPTEFLLLPQYRALEEY